MARLLIRYIPDPTDELGQLWFDLQTVSFSGRGYFWSNLSELPDIIEEIGRYPLAGPLSWTWDYRTGEGRIAVLSLAIAAHDPLGALEATIGIADLFDTDVRLTAKLRPDYAGLQRFALELSAMVKLEEGEARLDGL